MKRLTLTPALRKAARCIWFETPDEAIEDPVRFAAFVLTHGDFDDVSGLLEQFGMADVRNALDNAPPGIFDARSWAYWNVMVGRDEAPPMPVRRFE